MAPAKAAADKAFHQRTLSPSPGGHHVPLVGGGRSRGEREQGKKGSGGAAALTPSPSPERERGGAEKEQPRSTNRSGTEEKIWDFSGGTIRNEFSKKGVDRANEPKVRQMGQK